MHTKNLAALAAAVMLVAAPSAHAVATATATLSNFRYQLFDLNPLDGIAPAVTFAQGVYVDAFAHDGVTWDSNYDSGAVGTALSVSALMGASSSFAATTAGDPVGAGVLPGATAGASAVGAGSYAQGYGSVLNSSFTLTPYTLLVFTAAASGVSATATQLGEYASAYVQLGLYSEDNGQNSYGNAYASVQRDGSAYSSLPPTLTASFINLAGVEAAGYAYASAASYVAGVVAVVPEPETGAMLIAGLLVVGTLARRRSPR